MEGILAAAGVMVIILALLALTLKNYAAFWYKIMVAGPFAIINELMTTEEVPAGWRIRWLEALANRNRASWWGRSLYRLLVGWYLFRLGRLAHTVRISSLISKDDKADYMSAFQEIRSVWSSSSDLF